ncbi:MAG: 1-deoxy-D-xylulose-5-phosphate reductoisomerase [Bacteroidota bacterium]
MSEKQSKHIALLGSTGTVGKQVLEVVDFHPGEFVVEVLSAQSNAKLLAEQALKYDPNVVVLADSAEYQWLKDQLFDHGIKVYCGDSAIADVVQMEDIDIVVNAQSGISGITPSLKAVEVGKHLALANKESLMVMGDLLTRTASRRRANIYPLSHGNSAIFQCIVGEFQNKIQRLFLTKSGLTASYSESELSQGIGKENNFSSKKRIVDAATHFNVGFEAIESKWLYGTDTNSLEILNHPQGVIHGMVQFEDGSLKTVFANPDLKLPIQFALSYPIRLKSNLSDAKLQDTLSISLEKVNVAENKALSLCFEVIEAGEMSACVLNAANDVATQALIKGQINLSDIPYFVEECVAQTQKISDPNLEDYLSCDAGTRIKASELLKTKVS